jgi:DNA invertase Pin-like site-specific DNA recombinase
MPQPSTSATGPLRAAQYVRMSTEHQQYSTTNQEDVIREYAARRGYQIVRTYADEGKSGLNVAGREKLRQLIDDVQSARRSNGLRFQPACSRADFRAILVYDVSRWGRFQDADESAYYEYPVRKRRRSHLDNHQERQTGHGR